MNREITKALSKSLSDAYPNYLSISEIRDNVNDQLNIKMDRCELRKLLYGRVNTALKKGHIDVCSVTSNTGKRSKNKYRLSKEPRVESNHSTNSSDITESLMEVETKIISLNTRSEVLLKTLRQIEAAKSEFPKLGVFADESYKQILNESFEVAAQIGAYESILNNARQSTV